MTKTLIPNSIRFISLLLLQVLIVNQVELHHFINPYIYPLFILLLPINTPRWLQMVLGFILGMIIDMFASTPGLHASATVFLAFIRPHILQFNTPPSGEYEPKQSPTIKSLGLSWFLKYIIPAIFLHHLFYFFVEVYSPDYALFTLTKAACSALVSIILMVLLQYLFYSRA